MVNKLQIINNERVKYEEPCDGRLSSTVPREERGETPLSYSTGIVYSHFERWYKRDRVANVVPVTIVDRDNLSVSSVDTIVSEELPSSGGDALIQRFEIRFSNGLEIHHGEIDYRSFRSLVEKLEVLC